MVNQLAILLLFLNEGCIYLEDKGDILCASQLRAGIAPAQKAG